MTSEPYINTASKFSPIEVVEKSSNISSVISTVDTFPLSSIAFNSAPDISILSPMIYSVFVGGVNS